MDIVSRLKNFISHLSIPVTQFADNCSIPRPTLSQLLNGRNKKVSDELIAKIHEAYPDLSVLWLMFGEGDMLHKTNTQISEPQTQSIFDFDMGESADDEPHTPSIDFNHNYSQESSDNFSSAKTTPIQSSEPISTPQKAEESSVGASGQQMSSHTTEPQTTIQFNPDQRKQIVNIIVYYNDNSFESFVPNQK